MQSACREIIGTYEEKIERLMYSYAKTVEKNKKKNDDSSSTKSMSEAQEKAMMDDIFMKVCTREACKGIDLETYMEIEKSETGIKTSGIERTGQFADQDELWCIIIVVFLACAPVAKFFYNTHAFIYSPNLSLPLSNYIDL